jgi:hypothetical protein
MLQGYFDDSGSDGQRSPFVVAGYILPVERWTAFSDEWRSECDKVPHIEYFKMSEAASGVKQFSFSSEFRQYKVRALASVIHKHMLPGIVTWMRWEEFRAFNDGLDGPSKDQPYAPLFFGTIDNVVEYQHSLKLFPSDIQLDFDEQGSAGRSAIDWYARMIEVSEKHHIPMDFRRIMQGTPRMLDDKQYPPLQAADMLAWSIRLHADEGRAEKNDFGWLLDELRKTIWPGCRRFNADSWNHIARELMNPDRLKLL